MKSLSTLLTFFAIGGLQSSHATDQADFLTAISTTTSIRTAYNEMVQYQGLPPSTLDQLGIDESYYRSSLIHHIDIEPVSGAIMIGLSPAFGQNEWISLLPKYNTAGINEWICQTTASELLASNTGCRANLTYENLTTVLDTDLFLNTLVNTSAIKLNASEAYMEYGDLPTSMIELGVNQQWLSSANVDHLLVEPNSNTILLGLASMYGQNQWIAMTPIIHSYGYISSWQTKTTLPASIANAPGVTAGVAIESLLD